jgi:hypothetical protein
MRSALFIFIKSLMAKSSKLRTEAEHVYTLTDRMKVQLQVIEEMHGGVYVSINDYRGGDAESIACTVMMEASRAAADDLRAVMEQLKEINDVKKKMREQLQKSKDAKKSQYDLEGIVQLMVTLYVKQLTAEAHELQDDLDSMSEMGEMESLRLQMAMDRLSKMMSTLSNLLKKISDTSSQIVQNMK